MPVTKREEVTKQGFCKILGRTLRLRGSLLLVLIQFQFQSHFHSSGWGGGGRVFEFDCEEEGGGGGRLLTFFAFRMGANSSLGAYSIKYGISECKTGWSRFL